MAKSQKRSTREVRKPKAAKPKGNAPVGISHASPVMAVTRKPIDKL